MIWKRKGLPPGETLSKRIAFMSDEMLYVHAETQIMDAGMHLSKWRESQDAAEAVMAADAAQSAANALREIAARS